MNAVVEHQPEEKSAYDRLSRRERRFVDAYVPGRTGADAMRLVGYKGSQPERRAWRWLRKPHIAAAVEERERHYIAEMGVRAERIMRETIAIATLDPRKLIGPDGKPLKLQDLDDATAAAIAGLELEDISINGETGTRYKFKFWDKTKAIDKLGQFKKLWDTKGPTVNVDARSVTNNTVHVGGGEAIRSVADLGRAIAALGTGQGISSPDSHGSLLPAPVRAEPAGRGASVDAGENP